MSRFILFGLILIMHGVAGAATVLVFGDSLSAGYGLRQDESWPSLLEKRLKANRYTFAVANASMSGETTAGGRSRLDAALTQHRPEVVILALGANDGLRGLPLKQMRDNLEAIIQASHNARAKVLLVGMRMPPNYGPEYTEKFQQAYADLARAKKIPLVPFLLDGFAEKRELFQPDGIHPTAQAQALILDNVWPKLKPLLDGR